MKSLIGHNFSPLLVKYDLLYPILAKKGKGEARQYEENVKKQNEDTICQKNKWLKQSSRKEIILSQEKFFLFLFLGTGKQNGK